jgi:predicted membrane channel-forming protein YqfA (hemolysin III family)
MTRIPTLFFASAGLAALIGMAWGIQMSASGDHALSPAHGHLNLIGFVTMAVFGTYYALTPRAAATRLALLHYGLTLAAVVVLVPGIVMALSAQGEGLAKAGSVLTLASMALFLYTVLRHGVGKPQPRVEPAPGVPAE